jgi:hypothetical protein
MSYPEIKIIIIDDHPTIISGIKNMFRNKVDNIKVVVSMIPDSILPRVVVIRDSFFWFIMLFFDQHFSKTVYIFDAWAYGTNWPIIQKEKPDLVVLEIFGPHLRHLIKPF